MAGYQTGSPELFQAAKDIVSTNEGVQNILAQLRNTVDGLSSAWVGSAADAFNKLIQRFDEDAKKLQDALLAIAEQMDETATTYVQEEEAQSQEMSQIAGRLGGGA
ncbi:WXG100 family type VII secretion target [Saccharothrix deserti]|uniref:WXG100 family type VII secretion target n=1 Tax=Saccharothrix deserti TaxID=2593674 RepID=UPI00131D5E66|nr:WXG100 family type VII secretion target [Saccharothrix deserti]